MIYVNRPVVALPPHEVTLKEIQDDIVRAHPDHPRLPAILRVLDSTGVQHRRFARPLATVAADRPSAESNAEAYADLCELAERAAREALGAGGLAPLDVDCLITSHATAFAVPGLDVHLVNALGLRSTVSRIPMTQLGCAGGAHALVRAAEYLAAHPGQRVLIVAGEILSSVYQHSDDSMEAMIYKALFGDSAGACVVGDARPAGAAFRVDDTWEYVVPDSTERYEMTLDDRGFHFGSTPAALKGVGDLMPHLREWLGADTGAWKPQFTVAHTGGPRILMDLAKGLGCDPDVTRHSWESLQQRGNLGAVAVLDVLARTYDEPPATGDTGVLIGFGPGFTAAACRATWCGPTGAEERS
ncbi:PhlD [Streptomyces olivoreticuli]|uniref:type III polyketide synthase n=1 Tax=Streptomyces olivoreticuli TaxID=68246 RepID=UPI00265908A8|nr:PhlD [Streptomyces olivoreticuli]WKK27122.1 PhlD [Streptomyces olivoreticuli]